MAHDWPGNVRELRNVAERYALGLPAFKKGPSGGASQAWRLPRRWKPSSATCSAMPCNARRQPEPGQPGAGHGQDHAVRQSEKYGLG
jgi:two-component system response regulator AauR